MGLTLSSLIMSMIYINMGTLYTNFPIVIDKQI